jgi:hypothetical protein
MTKNMKQITRADCKALDAADPLARAREVVEQEWGEGLTLS